MSRLILPFADVGSGISHASGALLFFFETGTSTEKDTFSDEALTIANSNPVVANSKGVFPDIWITDGGYKVRLKNNGLTQEWEADEVSNYLTSSSLFKENYQAIRELSINSPGTIYAKGQVTAGDGGEGFFQRKVGAPGTYTDDNNKILIPTGGDGSVGWVRTPPSVTVGIMADLLAHTKISDKQIVNMLGYLTEGTGGGPLYWDESGDKTEHNGGSIIDPLVPFYSFTGAQADNEASVNTWYNGAISPVGTGVYRRLLEGEYLDVDFGVINSASYVYNEAFVNRKAYETLLRVPECNQARFVSKPNTSYIWGSINVGRSNLTIVHDAGCNIIGRYDDPQQLALPQAGHLFGFVGYADPYPGTDYTVINTVYRINYILNGLASTEFNAGHSQLHNNNVFGFYDTEDCSVVGVGGIPKSDHNGVAFDGLCVNPKVDLSYIKTYDDRAVTMKGTSGVVDTAVITIGKISGATRNGSVSESILVQDFDYVSVTIGEASLNLASLGTFVNSINCRLVDVNTGYLENAIFWVALSDTGQVNINGGRYKNVSNIVRRGGTSPAVIPQKRIRIRDIECISTLNGIIYLSQVAVGAWTDLEVIDCDFSGATGTLTPYSGYLAASAPTTQNFQNNLVPVGWVYDSRIWNEKLGRPNTAVGGASFTYDFAGTDGDQPYGEITIIMTHSSSAYRYPLVMSLRDFLLTGAQYRQSAVADNGDILEITTTKTGTSVLFSFTATAGTGTISNYSLSN